MFDAWSESVQELLLGSILGFAEAAWAFIQSAFTVGDLDAEWWVPVIGGEITTEIDGEVVSRVDHPGMLNVMVRALIPVLGMFVALQLVLSAFRSSTAGFMRALGTAVFAIPATYVLAGLMWMILEAVDRMTLWILDTGAGGDDSQEVAMSALLNLFGLAYNPESGDVVMDENYQHWAMAVDQENPGKILMPWIVMVVIWLLCLVLMGMMLFRTVVIMLLTVFMPLAVFSLALEGAKAIFSRWVSLVVALIMAKPLAAVTVMFGMSLGAIGDSWVQLVAGMIVIAVAAAMPLGLLLLISFATGGASDALERGGRDAGRNVSQRAAHATRGAGGVAARAGQSTVRTLRR